MHAGLCKHAQRAVLQKLQNYMIDDYRQLLQRLQELQLLQTDYRQCYSVTVLQCYSSYSSYSGHKAVTTSMHTGLPGQYFGQCPPKSREVAAWIPIVHARILSHSASLRVHLERNTPSKTLGNTYTGVEAHTQTTPFWSVPTKKSGGCGVDSHRSRTNFIAFG